MCPACFHPLAELSAVSEVLCKAVCTIRLRETVSKAAADVVFRGTDLISTDFERIKFVQYDNFLFSESQEEIPKVFDACGAAEIRGNPAESENTVAEQGRQGV